MFTDLGYMGELAHSASPSSFAAKKIRRSSIGHDFQLACPTAEQSRYSNSRCRWEISCRPPMLSDQGVTWKQGVKLASGSLRAVCKKGPERKRSLWASVHAETSSQPGASFQAYLI